MNRAIAIIVVLAAFVAASSMSYSDKQAQANHCSAMVEQGFWPTGACK